MIIPTSIVRSTYIANLQLMWKVSTYRDAVHLMLTEEIIRTVIPYTVAFPTRRDQHRYYLLYAFTKIFTLLR